MRCSSLGARVVSLLVALMAASSALPAQVSLRIGWLGMNSRATVVDDASCLSTAPPALFGCGRGSDGRALSARGDFGRGSGLEVAAGAQVRRDLRLEVAALALRGLALDARANFVRVSGEQPVSGDLRSDALLAVLSWEPAATFGWRLGRVRPYLSAGVGGARHRLGDVTFRFPGIAANAVTITQGGTRQSGAWMLGLGTGIELGPHWALDVALRRLDLGDAATDPGPATIVRPSRTFALRVAPIQARVRGDALLVGLRWTA
jgi:opacity protein-like surface antigen